MNPEEIDAWYEEQKQQLLDQYVKELEEKKEDPKKLEKKFTDKVLKIHSQYEKLYSKKIKHKKEIKSLNKFIEFMNKISEMYR